MNKLNIIGRLTKDIELRKTSNGTSVAQIDIAVKRNYKNQHNEYDTDFFNLEAFGNNADFLLKYCHKGDMVGFVARLQNANYEKDGKTVYKNAIIVEETTLLGTKKTSDKPEEQVEEKDDFDGFTGEVILEESDLPF